MQAFDLSESLKLQTGVLFRKSGDRSSFFPPQPLRSFPIAYIFNKYGIEVPLNINYKIKEKSKILLGTSVGYNLFSKHYFNAFDKIYRASNSIKETQYLDVFANIGFEYDLTSAVSITAYSQLDLLKTQFNSKHSPNPDRHYLSFGFNIGYWLN